MMSSPLPRLVVGSDDALPQPIGGPAMPQHARGERRLVGRRRRVAAKLGRDTEVLMTGRARGGNSRLARAGLGDRGGAGERRGAVSYLDGLRGPRTVRGLLGRDRERLGELRCRVELAADQQPLDRAQEVEALMHVEADEHVVLEPLLGRWLGVHSAAAESESDEQQSVPHVSDPGW